MTWAWPFRRGPEPDPDVPWISPELAEPEGLVGVGGTLAPETLLRAYADGVFPWFSEGDPILWWSPDPRAVIELDGLHVSRRLARTIRSGRFRVTVNRCFAQVMRACGENREEGTWVTPEMVTGYTALHRQGHAHSVEVWAAPDEAPAAGGGSPGQSAIKTSGLPVPRFVSIRSNEVNAHSGPSTKYPIEWVFSRRGMPVEVVAEFDTWRRIRDRDGTEGWVLQGMLSAKRSVIVVGGTRTLRHDPTPAGRPVAQAETGVIGQLLLCRDNWCEIDAGGYHGWLRQEELWGVYPNERLE